MFPTKLMLLTNIWRGYTHLTLRLKNIFCKISTLAFPKTPQLISNLTMKDCFPLKIRNKTENQLLLFLFNTVLVWFSAKQLGKGKKRNSDWKGKWKIYLQMTRSSSQKIVRNLSQKLLELESLEKEFKKGAEYKITKFTAFLYTTTEQLKIKLIILFTIASKKNTQK